VSSCRTIRPALAPSADANRHLAARETLRASDRLATFAAAISSTRKHGAAEHPQRHSRLGSDHVKTKGRR
jgi:hypothetical protein